jgi:asparagine synthetase B (glutamine-hydrolysing)
MNLPGITVFIGENPDLNFNKKIPESSNLTTKLFQAKNLKGFLRFHNFNKFSGIYNSGQEGVVIDASPGLEFNNKKVFPKQVHKLYSLYGTNFIKNLRGHFQLIAWSNEKNEIILASSLYGFRTHYYYNESNRFYLSPEAKQIAYFSDVNLKINNKKIYNLLSYPNHILETETWFEKIKKFRSSNIIIWKRVKIIKDFKYKEFSDLIQKKKKETVNKNEIRSLINRFKKILRSSLDTQLNNSLGLTGGLDSRLLLALMPKSYRKKIDLYNWTADKNSEEFKIANDVVKKLNLKLNHFKLNKNSFINNHDQKIRLIEGNDTITEGFILDIYRKIIKNKNQVLLDGLALGVCFGGFAYSNFYNKDLTTIKFQSFKRFYFNEIIKLKYLDHDIFINPKIANSNINYVKSNLMKRFTKVSENNFDSVDNFWVNQRLCGMHHGRQSWKKFGLETIYPTLHEDIITSIFKFSPNLRYSHNLYQKIFKILSPQLLKFNYQKTLHSGFVPSIYWKQLEKIELEKEDYFRQIFYKTNSKTFHPYNRYYSNLDEYMRTQKKWKTYICDTLLSNKSIITSILKKKFIKNVLNEQFEGKSNNHKFINMLLTIENMLREYS